MKLVVKSRELKWAGETLLKGAEVTPKTDRDHKHLDLLMKIGKVEQASDLKPLRQVATMRQPAPPPIVEPEPSYVTASTQAEAATDEPEAKRSYRRRDLRAED